ncbi:MAG: DUF4394 domain-containing protein [Planctomycetota bacterium]
MGQPVVVHALEGQPFGFGQGVEDIADDPGATSAALTSALNGSAFGFDFNPTIDRIRNVSDANQNLVLNPNDGSSTRVTDLFYAAGDPNEGADPNVVHSAYTNSFAGATSTQLFGIDVGLDTLVTQANSAGTLETVGTIGLDVLSTGGFDISGTTGTAFLAVEGTGLDAGFTMFWEIDLATGLGSSSTGSPLVSNQVGGGELLTAIAVVPEPGTATALLAAVGLFGLRRRATHPRG